MVAFDAPFRDKIMTTRGASVSVGFIAQNKGSRMKPVGALIGLMLVAIPTVTWLCATPAKADLRKEIAQRFQVEEGSFVLNLPPRPGCLPGSIFTEDLRFPIVRTKSDDDALERGPSFQFNTDFGFDAGANVSAGLAEWFGLAARASTASNVTLQFTDAHVIDILAPELKRRVLQDPGARAAATRNVSPFVVSRAYEGKLTVKLTRKNGASAEAWGRIKQEAIDARVGANIGNDDTVTYAVGEPFVFAFEIVRASYVAEHLGSSANDVILAPVPEDLFAR
jgi:hypothetical protein